MNYDGLNKELRKISTTINKITQGRLTEETVKRYDEMETAMNELIQLRDRHVAVMESVQELVVIIDAKKQQIIERTYKQVIDNFISFG